MKKAIQKKKSIMLLIWIIPIVALIISILMINKEYEKKGENIVIEFNNVTGLKSKKSVVKYKGIKVGEIENIRIDNKNINKFLVDVRMNKNYDFLVKDGTKFWKVSPKVSISKIENIGTAITGSYIALMPKYQNKEKLEELKSKKYFNGLNNKPLRNGIFTTLISKDGSLGVDSIVVYKGIEVGKIISKKLVKNKIDYKILIYNKYKYILSSQSKFVKMGNVEFKASLDNIKLTIPSLKTMIGGGIEIITKIRDNNPKQEYKLFDNKEDIAYNQNSFRLITSSKEKFSTIVFKGVKVGKIVDSYYDIKNNKEILRVELKNKFIYLLKKSPTFYIKSPKINIRNLKNIIKSPVVEIDVKNQQSEVKKTYILHSNKLIKGYEFSFKTTVENISIGDKIIYKGTKIGEIEQIHLQGSKLLIKAKIYQKYKYLINNSTYFYKLSAVEMKASLKGVYVHFGDVKDALLGGIGFITPKKEKLTKREFLLFSSKDVLKKYLYAKDGGKFITILVNNLDFIKKGTSINYKGFNIGEVIDYKLNSKTNLIEVEVYIKKEYKNLVNKTTKFFKDSGIEVKLGVNGVKVASKPIAGIINGVISMETFSNKADSVNKFKLFTKDELNRENYFFVKLKMNNGFGLKVGSKLILKSIKIGSVEKIKLDKNIIVIIKVAKKYKKYFGKNSKIWLENLKISMQGIKNITTPIFGSNLYLLSDKNNGFKSQFNLDSVNPSETKYLKGLRVFLKASVRGSLQVGTPIYYRKVVIGRIENIKLNNNGEFVNIKIFIYPQYAKFVRKNTYFYNTSIMGIDVGLFSAKIRMGTIESMFKGGIEIATPNNAGKLATNGEIFHLENNPQDDWKDWKPDLSIKK